MEEVRSPEAHINEEPRNDFIDVAVGMAVTFIGFLVIAILFTLISFAIQ